MSSLLFEQTELMSGFLQIPKSTKHFPSEYYCNKHCPSGAPILHAEFLSTVHWDFWQELQGAYGISVLDRDVLLMEKTIVPLPCKDVLSCMGIMLGYLNIIPDLVNSKRTIQKCISKNDMEADLI